MGWWETRPERGRRRRSAVRDVADGPDDLYRREYLAMVRLAVAMVGPRNIAREIVQDAFAEVVLGTARQSRLYADGVRH